MRHIGEGKRIVQMANVRIGSHTRVENEAVFIQIFSPPLSAND